MVEGHQDLLADIYRAKAARNKGLGIGDWGLEAQATVSNP